MGILGSFHCVGMCGPLALSLPLNNNSVVSKFFGVLIYNLGRVTTYSVFGAVLGLVGHSVAFFGWQQMLSISIGVIIILLVMFSKQLKTVSASQSFINSLFAKIRTRLGYLFQSKNFTSLFTIGILNGLLPCGLVYLATAGAIATGGFYTSVLFMICFGLGTVPAMWAVAFFGNQLSLSVRQTIQKAFPFIMVMMGCLLIIRGLGFGIPYLSPKINAENKTEQIKCCGKH
jgi:sulfite exporter TauE/SafE